MTESPTEVAAYEPVMGLEVHAELARSHRGRFHEAESLSRAALTDLLQELIDRGHRVTCVDVYKGWMEVDTFEDYRRAWSEIRA